MPGRKLRFKLQPDAEESATAANKGENNHESLPATPSKRRSRRESSEKMKEKTQQPLLELEAMIRENKLSYPGVEDDIKEFRALAERYSPQDGSTTQDDASGMLGQWVLASRLEGMQHKQQAFLGDRSHPHLKALDALVPHLTYPGWPADMQSALKSYYQHNNEWNCQRDLFRLRQRQCVFAGDRSHPRLVELDQVGGKLSYPGHARDVAACEQVHFGYPDDYVGNSVVARHVQCLRNRQAHWDGTLASSKELERLRPRLSYSNDTDADADIDGNLQEDLHAVMEAQLQPCSILESSGQVMDYTTALQRVQHKQSVLVERDRSHPRLVALDQLLLCESSGRTTTTITNPQTLELIRELEQVHFRYATDDWVGNAIFERLLQALKRQLQRAQQKTSSSPAPASPLMPSTPSKIFVKKGSSGIVGNGNNNHKLGSPSSLITASTISASWSHGSLSDDNNNNNNNNDDDNDMVRGGLERGWPEEPDHPPGDVCMS